MSTATYDVAIVTEPPGAAVSVLDAEGLEVYRGESPATVTLSAKRGWFTGQDFTVLAQMDGFGVQRAPVRRSLDAWYIGNLVFGWGIGFLIVDPLTGAMWKLDREVRITLSPGQDEP